MQGFSWVERGKLAGMPKPGDWNRLESDLTYLREQGIRLLFTLTESALDSDLLARFDIASVHLPVRDFTPPSEDQLLQFVREATVAISQGRAVGVHCRAGIGRTGTFLAAWLIAQGMTAPAAIAKLRSLRPGSIETREQEQALHAFAKRLKEQSAQP